MRFAEINKIWPNWAWTEYSLYADALALALKLLRIKHLFYFEIEYVVDIPLCFYFLNYYLLYNNFNLKLLNIGD